MQTKLTLRIEQELIKQAKTYAAEHGRSVSQLVGDYFSLLTSDAPIPESETTPMIGELRGIMSGASVDEADYRTNLEHKYL